MLPLLCQPGAFGAPGYTVAVVTACCQFPPLRFTASPNDQQSEFNFRRTSSVQLKVYGVDNTALDDITERLNALVEVLESAEGVLTIVPPAAAAA